MIINVSVVIPVYNDCRNTRQCLSSLFDTDFKEFEVILIDNASRDGTKEAVEERFKNTVILRNQRRMGYIYNNNRAIERSQGRYILLLNADTELREDTLQIMLDFMEKNPKTAVSGCKLMFDDGTLQLTCRRFPTPLVYIARIPHFFRWIKTGKKFATSRVTRRYLMLDYDHKDSREVDWVLSAFFLMRKSTIAEIGRLDGARIFGNIDANRTIRDERDLFRRCPVYHSTRKRNRERDACKKNQYTLVMLDRPAYIL
ncbi:MAG: glycosyltransferase [Deltaproteobacteria bacterium]|nr:glycosyltransferase [Deltaproteobacteria bacterium]